MMGEDVDALPRLINAHASMQTGVDPRLSDAKSSQRWLDADNNYEGGLQV